MRPEQWAEQHDGLLCNEAARAAGLTRGQMNARRANGRYRPVRRGVVAIAGAPPTWMQHVRAVSLSCGNRFVISHQTAARLLGGRVRDDETIHVSGPLDRNVRFDFVTCHRSGTLEACDLTVWSGVPCTSPGRTVIDLSAALPPRELGALLDQFLRARMINLEEFRERVARLRPAPGRSMKTLRRLLADRVPGYDPGESELEGRIMRIIDRADLPRPSQQHRVQLDGHRYRIDFAWPDRRLYLEGNGFGFHRLASDLHRDAERQNSLVLDGWTPIEITWRMSNAHIEATLRRFLNRV